MKKNYPVSLVLSLLSGLLLGGTVLRKESWDIDVYGKVPVPFDAAGCPCEGPEDAPVVITEFSDMDCPYSARNVQSIDSVKRRYGGKVRYCFRHFPLQSHEFAALKAAAVVAADAQGKAAEMRELLFRVRPFDNVEPAIMGMAAGLELRNEEFTEALHAPETGIRVIEDKRKGIECGVRSTPTVIINGYLIKGAAGFDRYASVIDKLISTPHPE